MQMLKIKGVSTKKWGISLINTKGVLYLEVNMGLKTWLIARG